MRAAAPPPTLDYERHRPHHLATRLERRGNRFCTIGRWCLASAAIAVLIPATSLVVFFFIARVCPPRGKEALVMLIPLVFVLSFLFAIIACSIGVILQAFGDAYVERAEILTHLRADTQRDGHIH